MENIQLFCTWAVVLAGIAAIVLALVAIALRVVEGFLARTVRQVHGTKVSNSDEVSVEERLRRASDMEWPNCKIERPIIPDMPSAPEPPPQPAPAAAAPTVTCPRCNKPSCVNPIQTKIEEGAAYFVFKCPHCGKGFMKPCS